MPGTRQPFVGVVPGSRRTGFHVAVTGSDSNPGTSAAPWRTLQKAFNTLTAGQTALVHAGTYREQVDPPRGGSSASARITVKAAPGETVYWKGSERVTSWSSIGGGVWEVVIANTFFGSFNPYSTAVSISGVYHLGQVYLDGTPYVEVTSSGAVNAEGKWWCDVAGGNTTIRAHFGANNPNTQSAEINVRASWIYATALDGSLISGVNYLELRGFHFAHVATQWAHPDGGGDPTMFPQPGGVIPNGGRGWLIERNWFTDARNCAIAIGLYTGEQDESTVGHHTIRYNTFDRWGQCAIVGSHGSFGSLIEYNLIQNGGNGDLWSGFEQAGIKLHTAIDVTIGHNIIRGLPTTTHGLFGVWIDWQAQMTRITGNVMYGIVSAPLWFEANHGPILCDNNVFHAASTSELGGLTSENTVAAHNLCVRTPWTAGASDGRTPNYWTAHTANSAGTSSLAAKDNKHYNNLFSETGTNNIGNSSGFASDYNVIWNGSKTSWGDTHSIAESFTAGVSCTDLSNGVTVALTANGSPVSVGCPVITKTFIGNGSLTGVGLENPDGSAITIDTDLLGNARGASPKAGPFQGIASGSNSFILYAGADAP